MRLLFDSPMEKLADDFVPGAFDGTYEHDAGEYLVLAIPCFSSPTFSLKSTS